MEIQKYIKDKQNKYKVIIDEEEYILYDDVIVKYNLLLKKEIDQDLFDEIMDLNDRLKSYYESIKYISKKIRSEKEIRDYLRKKEIANDIINETIDRLKKNNFINDETFIKCFVNDQINLSNNGPLKIKNSLLKLGIDDDLIINKLNSIDEEIWHKKVKNYIDKKIKVNTKSSAYQLKSKIKMDLLNLGYDKSIIDEELMNIKIDDRDIKEKEYNKIKASLEKKYSGYELELKIKEKMYRKGFRVSDYEE